MNSSPIRPDSQSPAQPSHSNLYNTLDGGAELAIVPWGKHAALDVTIHNPDRILGLLRERIIPKGLVFEYTLGKYVFDDLDFSAPGQVDGVWARRYDDLQSRKEILPLQSLLDGGLRFWVPFGEGREGYHNESANLRGYDAITHLFAFVGYKVPEPMRTELQTLVRLIQQYGSGTSVQTIHFSDGSAIQYNGRSIHYSNRPALATLSIYSTLGVMFGPEMGSLANKWADIEPHYKEMMDHIKKKFG